MPTRTPDTGQSKRNPPPPASGEDKSEQDARDMSSQRQKQNQNIDEDIEKPDQVEIGDPVPEDDRTVRAGGETGEDEDLPPDNGNIERH
jgi:hypothetical protein